MVDHASVFYIVPGGPYVLFYDDDLEKLKAPKRRWFIRGTYKVFGRISFMTFEPFQIYRRFGEPAMRIVYNPEATEHSRRADHYVDRVVLVDDDLITKGESQFRLTFPQGLPIELIKSCTPPEVSH
jgi:hypothetical protein